MSILDSLLKLDDDDLLCEEVEEKTEKTFPHSLKRKRDDLEEGEIEEGEEKEGEEGQEGQVQEGKEEEGEEG